MRNDEYDHFWTHKKKLIREKMNWFLLPNDLCTRNPCGYIPGLSSDYQLFQHLLLVSCNSVGLSLCVKGVCKNTCGLTSCFFADVSLLHSFVISARSKLAHFAIWGLDSRTRIPLCVLMATVDETNIKTTPLHRIVAGEVQPALWFDIWTTLFILFFYSTRQTTPAKESKQKKPFVK